MQVSGTSLSDEVPWDSSENFGDALLAPTELYVKRLLSLIDTVDVKVTLQAPLGTLVACHIVLLHTCASARHTQTCSGRIMCDDLCCRVWFISRVVVSQRTSHA